MKIAYCVCTPDTKGRYLAYRGELKEMFTSLKEIGYQGVEAFVRDPREMDQVLFFSLLEQSDLELAAVGTGPIVTEDKLTLASPDESIRTEAIKRTKAAVENIPNLMLMIDLFHLHIEDKSQAASLIEAKDYNFHVHFADNHRGIPGTGMINFTDAVRVLKALGYNRYISMEVEQTRDCYAAAKACFEYVDQLLKE